MPLIVMAMVFLVLWSVPLLLLYLFWWEGHDLS